MDGYIRGMCKEFLFSYYMSKSEAFYQLYNSHIKEHSDYLLNGYPLSEHWMSNYNVSYIMLCCETIMHRWENMNEEDAKKEILKEIKIYAGNKASNLLDEYTPKVDKTVRERGTLLRTLARSKRRYFLLLTMYYYCIYGDTWNGMIYTPDMKPLQPETYIERVEDEYGFRETFAENRFVKRGIQKLRKLLFEKMASINGMKEYNWERLGEAILVAFASTNGFMDGVPGVNIGSCRISLHERYEYIYYVLAELKCFIGVSGNDYSYMEDLKEDSEQAVDVILQSFILSHMLKEITVVHDEEEDMTKYTDGEEKELKPNIVNRIVVNADLNDLAVSCIWGMVIHLVHKTFSIYQEREVGVQAGKVMSEKNLFKKEYDEMMEMNENLKKENEGLKQEVDVLKDKIKKMSQQEKQHSVATKAKKEKKDKKDEKIRELERDIRRRDLELERVQSALEEAKNINLGLTQKMERMRAKRDEKIPEADRNKRYLFVCQHETTSKRIMEAFPNSIIASNYDITPANVGGIDAVICITKEISHGEYARVKNQCIQYDMPFINCNVINIERISQSIAAVMGAA